MTFGEQNSQPSFEIMDFAYDSGVNFIDTQKCIHHIQKRKHMVYQKK